MYEEWLHAFALSLILLACVSVFATPLNPYTAIASSGLIAALWVKVKPQ